LVAESFDVGNNTLTGAIPTFFGGFPTLARLALNDNNFVGATIPMEIAQSPTLRALNLSRTGIAGAIPAEFANAAALGECYLSFKAGRKVH